MPDSQHSNWIKVGVKVNPGDSLISTGTTGGGKVSRLVEDAVVFGLVLEDAHTDPAEAKFLDRLAGNGFVGYVSDGLGEGGCCHGEWGNEQKGRDRTPGGSSWQEDGGTGRKTDAGREPIP